MASVISVMNLFSFFDFTLPCPWTTTESGDGAAAFLGV
jgi:hypothetical protein